MKSLCFWNSNRVWGGGEKWHYDVALRLHEAGHPVLAITNRNSDLYRRLSRKNLTLSPVRISTLSFLNPVKILMMARLLRQHQVQAIFLNLPSDLKLGGIAAKLAGVPHIVYRRGIALPISDTLLNRWLFRSVVTRVIVNSEETRQRMLQNNPALIEPEKLTILYNGLDLAAYDREVGPPIYPKQAGELLLGHAGRLSEEKGQKYLLELVRILKERGTRCKLLIAGAGKEESALKRSARSLGVDSDIVFLGFVEQMPQFMNTLDIFVFSSLYEGFGYAIVEAMAARKPVVAFHVGSIPEIVEHGHTGFLVEQGDMTRFSHYVEYLITHPEHRERLGQQARKIVVKKFEIGRVVSHITELIED